MTDAPRFRREADMLTPLAALSDAFLSDATVLFEVACTAGVPDLVLLQVDHDAVRDRKGAAPLEHPVDVTALLALQSSLDVPMPAHAIADWVHVSAEHLRRRVLPRLVESGHALAMDNGWHSTYSFRSLARRVITIETKLRDWRGGLAQASRHAVVADEAWLVVDERAIAPARTRLAGFDMLDVGLASLSTDERLERLSTPRVNRSRQPGRELLVERAVALHLAGQVSGALPRVFGTVLVATEADPRLAGAPGR
jgi:hypothetical protein